MRGAVVNTVFLAVLLSAALAFKLGIVSPADAFFGVTAPIVLYLGYQFARRHGMPLGEALVDIFARPPASGRGRALHVITLASLGLGLFVMAQALAQV